MLYSTVLKAVLETMYGPLPETPDDDEAGLVLVADGVGGLNLLATSLQYVMPTSGQRHAVQVVSWGHGFGRWHLDLTNVDNHEAQGQALANAVEGFRTGGRAGPVFLVGKSGGSGVVVRALERLPDGAVEAAVLLAPAISPGYDLTRALRAVGRELVVFWSPLDVFILGLGTRIFGTIDRVRDVSAGLVGFRVPEGLDHEGLRQYAKLRQVRWHPRMAPTGYLGGHVGPDSPAFLKRYVVPLLIAGESKPMSSPARDAPIT